MIAEIIAGAIIIGIIILIFLGLWWLCSLAIEGIINLGIVIGATPDIIFMGVVAFICAFFFICCCGGNKIHVKED